MQPSVSIAKSWPPEPGPSQPNTGWKQRAVYLKSTEPHIEALTDLHPHNWWSGLRINMEVPDGAILRCRITAGSITLAEWNQKPNVWTPLPMLISAAMADNEGLCLETVLLRCADPVYANIRICWHMLG
jgi:hypothetical protein